MSNGLFTNSTKLAGVKDSLSKLFTIGLMLGWQDLRQAYRRSAIGPLWLTIGMVVQILTMGLVFSLIFKIPLRDYLPFLASSMLVWSLISSSVIEGCNAFISAEGMIRQLKLPTFIFPIRVVWKNLLNFGHNLVILPLVFIPFSTKIGPIMFVSLAGFVLLILNLIWIVSILSLACARFRDLGPIVNSLVTIAYFVTPIMWQPNSLGDSSLAHLLLGLNPLYHLIQICRQPLVGALPTLENWIGAVVLLVAGLIITKYVYKKFSSHIAFWV